MRTISDASTPHIPANSLTAGRPPLQMIAPPTAAQMQIVGGGQRGLGESPDDPTKAATNWVICLAMVLTALAVFLAVAPQTWHWFVIPVGACGVLIGVDSVAWARKQLDTFDPQGILGLFGIHFFFFAPLLHVALDYWPVYLVPSAPWRDLLGTMAILNAVGLGIYRLILSVPRRRPSQRRTRLELNVPRLTWILGGWLVVGMSAFVYQFYLFGGPSGFLARVGEGRAAFLGTYQVLLPADTFPLTALTLVLVRRRHQLARRPLILLLLFATFVIMQFLMSGLRGSRAATVWPVVIGLILVHLLVVRASRKILAVCCAGFVLFMFTYGIFKSAGTEVVDVVRGDQSVSQLSEKTGRNLSSILLQDLGRADVQALVLDYKFRGYGELGLGRSYLGDLAILVPRSIIAQSDRPLSKIYYGTVTLRGAAAFNYDRNQWVTNVYGISGEAMLNFGPYAGPAGLAALALLVRQVRTLYFKALARDELIPKLMAPALIIGVLLTLGADLDSIAVFALTRVVPISAAILLSVTLVKTESSVGAGGPGSG